MKASMPLMATVLMTHLSIASATPISSGVPIQAGNAGCELLSEAVTINLSSNVYGAYHCDLDNNVIRIATCHKAGSRKKSTVNCAVVNVNNGVNEWNDASCSDAKAEAAANGGAAHTFETNDKGKAFSVSTSGGIVGAVSLDAACTSATALEAVIGN
ncbi:hypothetical protein HW090_06955 [Pseudomonas sp. ABC1]|uniref:hypothetical protein n=1 Tax=Pseudomonas sp. ABC1 TaxID=2748080 RepID=UPI0015C3146A|nr:hypothetical protein [Pseudomonas sp. ABC1]QLF92945.1 hypothetical protein HW090_06955 [Pseudomonas sp. ABC1]